MDYIEKMKEKGACQVDISFIQEGYEVTVWVDEGDCKDGFSILRESLTEALHVALEELIEEREGE